MDDCYCDYEAPEFYVQETRRAKKEHRCSECGRAIDAGESYEHVRGKWGGEMGTYKTCSRCLALKNWVKAHVPCACIPHGNLVEESVEAARNYSHEAPGLLFGAYRRQIAIKRHRKAQATNPIPEGGQHGPD